MKIIIFLENNPMHLRIDYNEIADKDKYLFFVLCESNPYKDKEKYKDLQNVHFIELDRLDYDSAAAKVREIQEAHGEVSLFVTSEELAVVVCSQLNRDFSTELRGAEDSKRFIDKTVMKERLKAKFPDAAPKYMEFDDKRYKKEGDAYLRRLSSALDFPMFVKPKSIVGGFGTAKINDFASLKKWAEVTRPTMSSIDFELEEFLSGEQFHCETFIKDSKILFTHAGRYSVACSEFMNGAPLGSILLDDDSETAKELVIFAHQVHEALGSPKAGITHLEVFKTPSGKYKFVEIAYRPPGANIPGLYRKRYGISLHQCHILLQIDSEFMPTITLGKYAAHIDFPPLNGKVLSKKEFPKFKSNLVVSGQVEEGQDLSNPEHIGEWVIRATLFSSYPKRLNREFKILSKFSPFVVAKKDEKQHVHTHSRLLTQLRMGEKREGKTPDAKAKPPSGGHEQLPSYRFLSEFLESVNVIRLSRAPKSAQDIVSFFQSPLSNVIKTLLLTNEKSEVFVVSLCGDDTLDFEALKKLTDSKTIKMVSRDQTLGITGYATGGISPFISEEYRENIKGFLLDSRVSSLAGKINIGSGVPEIGIVLSVEELQLAWGKIGGTVAELRAPALPPQSAPSLSLNEGHHQVPESVRPS